MHYVITSDIELQNLFNSISNIVNADTISVNQIGVSNEGIKAVHVGVQSSNGLRSADVIHLDNDMSIQRYQTGTVIIFNNYGSSREYLYAI